MGIAAAEDPTPEPALKHDEVPSLVEGTTAPNAAAATVGGGGICAVDKAKPLFGVNGLGEMEILTIVRQQRVFSQLEKCAPTLVLQRDSKQNQPQVIAAEAKIEAAQCQQKWEIEAARHQWLLQTRETAAAAAIEGKRLEWACMRKDRHRYVNKQTLFYLVGTDSLDHFDSEDSNIVFGAKTLCLKS